MAAVPYIIGNPYIDADFAALGTGTGTVTSIVIGAGLASTQSPLTTTGTMSLAASGATPGTYGGATTVPQIAVDTYGRITGVSGVSTGFVNVTTFGASTGATAAANTTAFQAALNSAAGVSVYVPAGTWLLNGLSLPSGVTFFGSGVHSTILQCGSSSITLLGYFVPAGNPLGPQVRDMTLDANGQTGCTALLLHGLNDASRLLQTFIGNIAVKGIFSYGLDLYLCANTFISNLYIQSSTIGVHIDICADINLVSVDVQNGSGIGFFVGNSGGLGNPDGEGARLISCTTNGQGTGLVLSTQGWGTATGCSFTSDYNAPLMIFGSTNWKFAGCEFATGGLPVTNAAGTGATATLTFAGNVTIPVGTLLHVRGVTPAGYNGDYTVTASSSTTVSYANATTGYTSGGAIYPDQPGANIDSASSNITMTGCQFTLCGFGILSFADTVLVTGCFFTANFNTDCYLGATSQHSIFSNNVMASTGITFSIIELAGASYNSFVGNVCMGTISSAGTGSLSASNITSYP